VCSRDDSPRSPVVALAILVTEAAACRATRSAGVTVRGPHRLYAGRKYTVTQVVQWHLDRIGRYNIVYGAIETMFRSEALAEAARQDADSARGGGVARGPLWGADRRQGSKRKCTRSSDLMSPDGIHPNADGAKVISPSIWSGLRPLAESLAVATP
jgi:hypothetical protein